MRAEELDRESRLELRVLVVVVFVDTLGDFLDCVEAGVVFLEDE